MILNRKQVEIKCPICKNNVLGIIETNTEYPWDSYYGYCDKCDYHITESEWEKIKTEEI